MPKINQEEYEILKNLDDKWKWIARDENREVWVYKSKPVKLEKEWDSGVLTNLNNITFLKFIQWEDEKPHNIAELIEEYEVQKKIEDSVELGEQVIRDHARKQLQEESEETEVKDIEWLKKEIHKELEDWHGVEGGIDGDGINEIMLLINQHEEPEAKRLDKKIKNLESFNDFLIRSNNQLRNELDNQEVLSQEWIDEHKVPIFWTTEEQYAVRVEDLQESLVPKHPTVEVQELINKYSIDTMSTYDVKVEREKFVNDLQNLLVPKQDLPVIPRFVAGWIEFNKKQKKSLVFAITHIYGENEIGKSPDKETNKMFQWMESADNEELFARAWLDGYEIEQEPKYYAKIKGHELTDHTRQYWYFFKVDESLNIGMKPNHPLHIGKLNKIEWANLGITDDNADFELVEEVSENV